MERACGAVFAQPQYSVDNALGVAILTRRALERGAGVQCEAGDIGGLLPLFRQRLHLVFHAGQGRGEVSNYKCYPSGHHYFSLKDENASLRCVMFRGDAQHVPHRRPRR